MARIVVLGAGVMGSAMTVPAARNGHCASLLGTHLDSDIIRSVAGNGLHPGLKVTLPEAVRAADHGTLAEDLAASPDLVILGVSSAGIDWAIDRLSETLSAPVPILMITKGLAVRDGSLAILPHVLRDALKARTGLDIPVCAVGGPAIAGEQAAGRETSVVFTGVGAGDARGLLAGAGYLVSTSDDLIGVEMCAALKNFFALGVGTAAGRFEVAGPAGNGAAMHNLAASLFTQAVAELGVLVEGFGGDPATVHGLAGTGDLYVTCRAGRNSRMGRLLGLGIPYSRAKAEHMAADTVEGAELALTIGPTLRDAMADGRLEARRLPLTRAIIAAICDDAPFPGSLQALFDGYSAGRNS